MNQCVLYARKSDEDRNNQVRSIEDQKKELLEIIARENLPMPIVLEEEKSAKLAHNRPEFDKMIALLRKGKANAILVWSVNRLARNMTEGGMLQDMLSLGQVREIRTPHQTFQPGDNILPFILEVAQAAQYSLTLAVDVKRGLRGKVADGQLPQRAPEGYRNAQQVTGDILSNVILPDPERFDVVRRAWELLLSGHYSLARLQKTMNEDWGYTTRKSYGKRPARHFRVGGRPIAKSTLHRLLTNPFYAGYFSHKSAEGEMVKGSHLPMITPEEFQAAQAILKREGKARPQKREFPYTGLIFCARCGCQITAEEKAGRHGRGHYIYYRCTNMRGGGCGYHAVRQEMLEERIGSLLDTLAFDEEAVAVARRNIQELYDEESARWHAVFEQRRRKREEAKRRLSGLLDMRLDEEIEGEIYEEKKAALQAEINHLKLTEDSAERTLDWVREGCEEVVRYCEEAPAAFRLGETDKKRAIARVLGMRYLLRDDELEIELHPLLEPLRRVRQAEATAPTDAPAQTSQKPTMHIQWSKTLLPSAPMGQLQGLPTAGLEPQKSGLESKKDGSFKPSVPLGCEAGTDLGSAELKTELYRLFKQIADERLYFPKIVWSSPPASAL